MAPLVAGGVTNQLVDSVSELGRLCGVRCVDFHACMHVSLISRHICGVDLPRDVPYSFWEVFEHGFYACANADFYAEK